MGQETLFHAEKQGAITPAMTNMYTFCSHSARRDENVGVLFRMDQRL
ncbi:hypothetical protein GGQ76_000866 [Aureimonas jatrophae]|nr:hypothetical protein [Aureimonas jatrophae]